MGIGKPRRLKLPRLVGAAAAKAWPKLRPLLIVAIALSMAEFVALDAGLYLAADLMLYLELMLGAWAIAILGRFMPGLSATLMLLPARLLDPGSGSQAAPAEPEPPEEPDP